jgi:hypothetical protein
MTITFSFTFDHKVYFIAHIDKTGKLEITEVAKDKINFIHVDPLVTAEALQGLETINFIPSINYVEPDTKPSPYHPELYQMLFLEWALYLEADSPLAINPHYVDVMQVFKDKIGLESMLNSAVTQMLACSDYLLVPHWYHYIRMSVLRDRVVLLDSKVDCHLSHNINWLSPLD